ncbi:uncharacterized protein [Palaemon carinicauda]|uniref:uncharacterized protein n=1 Tax=Palaemon carinicauda TaxID=392227 RepID=UPI0035B61A38
MEPFSISDFSSNPSVHYLRNHRMRKDDWLAIAVNYDISVRKVWRKSQIKNFVINALVEGETLPEEAYDLLDEEGSKLTLKQLELQYAREKEEIDKRGESPSLKGKARTVFLSLTSSESNDYDFTKDSILKAYELMAEYYRLKFRRYKKFDSHSYIEYSHNLVKLHDKWYTAASVTILDEYRELILLEQFIRGVPIDVQRYLFEREVTTLQRAAVLAENYSLIKPHQHSQRQSKKSPGNVSEEKKSSGSYSRSLSEVRCYKCNQLGHMKARCPSNYKEGKSESSDQIWQLGRSSRKFLFLIVIVGVVDELPIRGVDFLMGNDLAGGKVVPSPVIVDTPLEVSPVEDPVLYPSCVVQRSRSLAVVEVPRERGTDVTKDVNVSTTSGTLGKDAVGTVDVDINIDSLFQTDSFGGNVKEKEIGLETKFGLKTGNVVMVNTVNSIENENNSSNVFDYSDNLFDMKCSDIIKAQQEDLSLQSIYSEVVAEDQINTEPVCYYLRNGLLMRKFRSLHTPASSTWEIRNQIVIPASLRQKVLHMAHNVSSSHLGIRKTLSAVLQLFYWPGIRKSVTEYCKSCAVCQLVGKPNQIIKPAPLQPIPVLPEPFDKVILDCVGPLPKSKKQNQYTITMMCSSIRYPDAYPLRNISSKTLIPVLIKFFTQYGIPNDYPD